MRRLWHLLALNSLALLQPILDQLSQNPEYLIVEDYSLAQLLVAVLLLALTIPILQFLLVKFLESRSKTRAANWLMTTFLGVWGTLCGLVAARSLSATFRLPDLGIPQFALALLALPVGALVVFLNRRSELFRQALSLTAIGILLFPLSLFQIPAIRYQLLGQPLAPKAPPGHVQNPVPVVMIVFDGLNGMSLLDANRQIHRQWFPGFARLADLSTCYRNATTVHTRTDHALPAILTSTIPEELQQPVEADYPTGLFRLISDSQQFDISIFEPLTRMSPPELRQFVHQRSNTRQTFTLLNTLLRVFAQITLPQEFGLQTAIPREWFGMVPLSGKAWRPMKGQIIYPWDENRAVQAEHFLASLQPTEKPGFRFLHIALPHYPWSLLPTGESYISNGLVSSAVFGLKAETWTSDPWPVQLAWLRNLMQIQYADRVIGRMLDVLEATGQLDDCLLVVTADHGMCFTPGKSLRDPTADTLPDLLPVPLFIKTPGQTHSAISDENVETIDILPTVAQILRMQTDPEWVGNALPSKTPKPRKTVRGALNTILEPDFPTRFQHTDRLLRIFSSADTLTSPQATQAVPALLAKPLAELTQTIPARPLQSYVVPPVVSRKMTPPSSIPGSTFIPSLIHGRILTPTNQQPVWIALAANGKILATTRTSNDPEIPGIWAAWIPPELIPPTETPLEVFEIHSPNSQTTLSSIPVIPGNHELRSWEPDWLFENSLFENSLFE